MTRTKCLALALATLASSLMSCSGVKQPCTSNCGNSNATVEVTLTATPLTPPANTNLLSFNVTVAGISLTPSGGGTAVNVPLNSTTYNVDLARLTSDSAFVAGSAGIPAGTYTGMTVSLSNPLVTYCTQTQGNIGCAAGTVAVVNTGAAAAPQITSAPFPITVNAGQTQGIAININLQNVLTVNSSQVVTAVNLGAANGVTANALPPGTSSLPAGPLSFIEDVTGVVTNVNGSSVTVKTATRGSITAVANSSTVFSPNCTSFNLALTFAGCVASGQVASLDLLLNSDGTFTLLEYDPLDTVSGDWIEGIVTAVPSSSTQFEIVTNDFVVSTANSLIGTQLTLGQPVNVTLSNLSQAFAVDSKGLTVVSNSFSGTDATVLQPGETVAVRLTAFTAGSGSTPAAATANFLYLRFTRVTGTVASTGSSTIFTMQSFPPFFNLTIPINVQLSTASPSTNFEGVTAGTGLTVGQTVSITALYFGPTGSSNPFSAAKVRTH